VVDWREFFSLKENEIRLYSYTASRKNQLIYIQPSKIYELKTSISVMPLTPMKDARKPKTAYSTSAKGK
jgi:hypothetical protein